LLDKKVPVLLIAREVRRRKLWFVFLNQKYKGCYMKMLKMSLLSLFAIATGSAFAGSHSTVSVSQHGYDNAAVVVQDAYASHATVKQVGVDNGAYLVQAGSHDTTKVTQYGYGNQAIVGQGGNHNTTTVQQSGAGNVAAVIQY
jgi:Curlin associated repeat